MTRGEKVIRFITEFCKVPEGPLVGKPLDLQPFQIKFIKDVYDNKHVTREAILSMARKNGKTALIACLVLAHLVGPEAKQNSQIASGAMSKDNAGLVFKLMQKMIMLEPRLAAITRVTPSTKTVVGLPMNVEYMALAKDGKTNMGGSPLLLILDETGQVVGPQDNFIDAVITSQGAHDAPLKIVISTQAANDGDLLSIWIDDALTGSDPQKVCHLYAADKEAAVLDKAGWKASNPALGVFRNLEDIKNMAGNASRMPSFENSFRNLYLNQRISTNSPFISKDAWFGCKGEVPPIEYCSEVYGGLDLSAKTDLTAFVLIGEYDLKWYVYPYFFTPEKGLIDRSKADRAPYDVWHRDGKLITTPGATVDIEWVVSCLPDLIGDANLVSIAYDRWRIDVFKKELERACLDLPMEEWGQGFKDMAPALDALESMILNQRLVHDGHPVLTMCAANALTVKNPSGDRKLDKMKTSGKIDGLVALAMACGIAERIEDNGGDFNSFISAPLVL